MTAPDPIGGGLVAAIEGALRVAGVEAGAVSAICAHGTGTRYNDEMEVRAFGRVAGHGAGCPFFSIKGAVGHTLGLAGLLEAVVSMEAARAQCAPPSVGCREPDVAGTPVLRECVRLPIGPVLSTNSGFGGVNTALVLEACSVGRGVGRSAAGATSGRRAALAGLSWMTDAEMGVCGAGRLRRMPVPCMDNPDGLFAGGYKNWGRVAPLARRLACVLEVGFRELNLAAGTGQPSDWGILGLNATGCHAENVAFFRDYLEHGRELARGALFVQTLPSTPIAEASIHYLLRGPLCHFVDPTMDFTRAVDWGCSMMTTGEVPGIVIAGLEENRVACAFIRAAGSVAEGADMEWADAMVRRVPCGTPADWLARLCTQG
jgi:3-oxoacyl-(acyl-carrier-protein) synthase